MPATRVTKSCRSATSGVFYVNQPVPLSEAMDVLRDAARPLAQMDDTLGACRRLDRGLTACFR